MYMSTNIGYWAAPAHARTRTHSPRGTRLGLYKILPIFYCNNNKDKGGRGENILRNIVGNKGVWEGDIAQ